MRGFTPLETIKKQGRYRVSLTGFTLIELLFVLLLVGILIAVSIPQLKKSFEGLQLNGFARELQSFMNYLSAEAVVKSEVIYLYLEPEKSICYAKVRGMESRLKTLSIPQGIELKTQESIIAFYPDAKIDKVSLTLNGAGGNSIILTTKGVVTGVKIEQKK